MRESQTSLSEVPYDPNRPSSFRIVAGEQAWIRCSFDIPQNKCWWFLLVLVYIYINTIDSNCDDDKIHTTYQQVSKREIKEILMYFLTFVKTALLSVRETQYSLFFLWNFLKALTFRQTAALYEVQPSPSMLLAKITELTVVYLEVTPHSNSPYVT